MRNIVIAEVNDIHTAIAFGLGRLGFAVTISDLNEGAKNRAISQIRKAGGKVAKTIMSVYDASWVAVRLIISCKLHHANFCHKKKIRFADTSGKLTLSPDFVDDVLSEKDLSSKLHFSIFGNLSLVPDWARRAREIRGDQHWTKMQKVLGFPAAAAAACFALGHYNMKKRFVSFKDVKPSCYRKNLEIIEGYKSIWRGEGYDC